MPLSQRIIPVSLYQVIQLNGLRWELPSLGSFNTSTCNCTNIVTANGWFGGDPAITYSVTLRIRGVVETVIINGGTQVANSNGIMQVGGTGTIPTGAGTMPSDGGNNGLRNLYTLVVANPSGFYYINRMSPTDPIVPATLGDTTAPSGDPYHPVTIDYTVTISIQGQSYIGITSNAIDALERKNLDRNSVPLTVPGISPYPAAFDGQFAQVDVTGVSP